MSALPPSDASAAHLFSYPEDDLRPQLEGQSALLVEFVDWARQMNAAMAAHRALAQALIATHPRPAALLDQFHQGMDMVADTVPPIQLEDYRRELHLLQSLMLNAINRQGGR